MQLLDRLGGLEVSWRIPEFVAELERRDLHVDIGDLIRFFPFADETYIRRFLDAGEYPGETLLLSFLKHDWPDAFPCALRLLQYKSTRSVEFYVSVLFLTDLTESQFALIASPLQEAANDGDDHPLADVVFGLASKFLTLMLERDLLPNKSFIRRLSRLLMEFGLPFINVWDLTACFFHLPEETVVFLHNQCGLNPRDLFLDSDWTTEGADRKRLVLFDEMGGTVDWGLVERHALQTRRRSIGSSIVCHSQDGYYI